MKLLSLSLEQLKKLITEWGYPAYRAQQISTALWQGKELEQFNIPKELKALLREKGCTVGGVQIHQKRVSCDGTVKYLYRLEDGNIIEGVFMRYKHGNTLCVSTQVGCRMGCAFCASTIGGLVRNLEPGEILGQVISANYDDGKIGERRITNIVLMGSGEPLDNYENVIKFIKLITDTNGLNISARNISLSTCGLVPGIYALAKEKLGITLSLSLHAPNDEIRRELMPVSHAYTIEDTVAAMRFYVKTTGRRVIFEYALVEQKNDTPECAGQLAALIRGMQCHVNLIPLNSVHESGLKGSGTERVKNFMEILQEKGASVTIRREMGADIAGACGQLRRSYLQKEGKS